MSEVNRLKDINLGLRYDEVVLIDSSLISHWFGFKSYIESATDILNKLEISYINIPNTSLLNKGLWKRLITPIPLDRDEVVMIYGVLKLCSECPWAADKYIVDKYTYIKEIKAQIENYLISKSIHEAIKE